MTPVVATSLLMGLLALQTTLALTLIPQWEAPTIEPRTYHYTNGTPDEDPRPHTAPPICDPETKDCIERECRPLLPGVVECGSWE